uniref:Proline iminopeptidase n=1 Tax=Hyaloperonospora arabidopsidis (strain Emoy2) TaxID=559515 RepID=M4BGJ0_HYAAE
MRRFHDPRVYRIILLDQRGSGRSQPHASLEENTTWHLVEDMEKLRCQLNIDKWQVFGGSWGSTLSIAYAITHPTQVTELVLRGIFHLRKQEIDFYYQSGANFIYPDRWEAYRDAIPEGERGDFVLAYHKRLTSDDPNVRIPAALAWTTWEKTTSNLIPPADAGDKSMDEEKFAEAFARIENHYFVNKGFFPTDEFLNENAHKIRHIPTVIVQGRRLGTSTRLFQRLTSAWSRRLVILPWSLALRRSSSTPPTNSRACKLAANCTRSRYQCA